MPNLPLPLGGPLDGSAFSVLTDDDVLALLPARYRRAAAPVRDAIVATLRQIAVAWQNATSYAAAQSDIATATGIYEDALVNDRDLVRAEGEQDDDLRARTLGTPDLVSPTAILALVNRILEPYTTARARYFEPLDCWYANDGSAEWASFVGTSPSYPDRLYADDANVNAGVFRDQLDPGGLRVFGDEYGRHLVLRLPPVVPEWLGAFVSDATTYAADYSNASFVGDGTTPDALGMYVSATSATALTLYQAVANSVAQIMGHGVRFSVLEDPTLTT